MVRSFIHSFLVANNIGASAAVIAVVAVVAVAVFVAGVAVAVVAGVVVAVVAVVVVVFVAAVVASVHPEAFVERAVVVSSSGPERVQQFGHLLNDPPAAVLAGKLF